MPQVRVVNCDETRAPQQVSTENADALGDTFYVVLLLCCTMFSVEYICALELCLDKSRGSECTSCGKIYVVALWILFATFC